MPQKLSDQPASPKSYLNLHRVGALTAVIYLLACLFFVKGPDVYRRPAREVFTWLCVLPLLYLFRRGYRLLKQSDDGSQLRTVIGFAAVFCLLAYLTFPFHSTDVFGYINRGWQQYHYGQNPYAHPIADLPQWQQDPMLRSHWIYNPIPYGFLFTRLTELVCRVGQGRWWLTLFLFKGLNVLAYGATAKLVWAGAKRLGHSRPLGVLYLFLWNPLVLLHLIANGHNDILTGCLVTLGLYLAVVGAGLWLLPVLAAAALLKYVPGLLVPFAFVFVVKRNGWRAALLGCLLSALVVVLVSAPYLADWQSFRLAAIVTNATLIDNSLHSFLIHLFENAARLLPALAPFHVRADTAIKTTLRLGFLVFLCVVAWRLPKNLTAEVLIEKSVLVMFVLICVVSSKFNGWYMGILLPPALLLPERHWLKRLVVLISCTELLSLTFFKQAYVLNYGAMILTPMLIVLRQEIRRRAGGRGPLSVSGETAPATLRTEA